MQLCCMQYLIFMQTCCMKIEHVQFPCNNQHTRCNKVARNISTYTMQQCCLQLCCMENLTYTMQQSCRQQLHATLLHRVWWALGKLTVQKVIIPTGDKRYETVSLTQGRPNCLVGTGLVWR